MLIYSVSCVFSFDVCLCVNVCVLFPQGFEPRGTYIGVRQSSLTELQENTGPGRKLSPLPQQLSERSAARFSRMQAFYTGGLHH